MAATITMTASYATPGDTIPRSAERSGLAPPRWAFSDAQCSPRASTTPLPAAAGLWGGHVPRLGCRPAPRHRQQPTVRDDCRNHRRISVCNTRVSGTAVSCAACRHQSDSVWTIPLHMVRQVHDPHRGHRCTQGTAFNETTCILLIKPAKHTGKPMNFRSRSRHRMARHACGRRNPVGRLYTKDVAHAG